MSEERRGLPDGITKLHALLSANDPIILDGGLATELEARGFNIHDPLWSAVVLLQKPEAIEQLHFDYISAGAQCITSASYQATIPGLKEKGLGRDEAIETLRLSVQLAIDARERFLRESTHPFSFAPLVAASIGPYGAYLHDGSEFRGDYGLTVSALADFHRERFGVLASSGADLLACETIPCRAEAEALLSVLKEYPTTTAWFSFSCKDGEHVCHGEPIRDCAALLDSHPQVAAIGVNCTAPRFVISLIEVLAKATSKPIIVYPNSGETWNDQERGWTGPGETKSFVQLAEAWRLAGARLIGGCCRIGPKQIRLLADHFSR
jgi:homocysteine S-methyltransferase